MQISLRLLFNGESVILDIFGELTLCQAVILLQSPYHTGSHHSSSNVCPLKGLLYTTEFTCIGARHAVTLARRYISFLSCFNYAKPLFYISQRKLQTVICLHTIFRVAVLLLLYSSEVTWIGARHAVTLARSLSSYSKSIGSSLSFSSIDIWTEVVCLF